MSDSELLDPDECLQQSCLDQRGQPGADYFYSAAPDTHLPYVKVVITSFPVAADVEVDGEFYGSAGEKFTIPLGTRRISVSLPGYAPWKKDIVLRQGETISVHAQLVKSADFRIVNE